MEKPLLAIALAAVLIIAGCTGIMTFEQGTAEFKKISDRYNVDFKSMPADIEKAVQMRNELKELESRSTNAPEQFKLLLNYEKKSLEANILNIKAWEQGGLASTRDGFGCKQLPVIFNSTKLRNASAQIGYTAVSTLQDFIDKYPDESKSVNLTQRDVLFTKYFYSEVEKEAVRDRKIVEFFCASKYDMNTMQLKPDAYGTDDQLGNNTEPEGDVLFEEIE